jgi:type IV pilus assembly protein PilM
MFNLFKTKINKSWGLHITDRHLRAIEIVGDQQNWRIERIGKIEFPPGTRENGLIKNPPVFQEAVKQLRAKTFPSPLRSPNVVVNLAEEHAFSRIIQTPPLEEAEMSEAIQWEAESNIPLPIDKVYLAWETLSSKENNKNQVLLTATTKNIVDDLIKNLKLASLSPVMIESESAARVGSHFKTRKH